MTPGLASFTRLLPKAELHLHIEGSLEPEQMFAFAKRNRVALPFANVGEARAAYAFSKLQDFLDIYYAGAGVLLQEEDFHDLALAYFERLHADGGVHAEIFFDPQTHTDRGVPFDAVAGGLLAGMAAAREKFGITSALILCFLRHLPEENAIAALRMAEPWLDRIIGVGLDSSEAGHPPRKFARVFAAARERGLKCVAHAGEEGPPEYVLEALDVLRIDRLDHGNRSLEDAGLVRRLAASGMALTVCPLSNLRLCVVKDLAAHPIRKMLELGLRATINSDDPAYFGGYLLDNYLRTAGALSLTRAEITALARNSFLGSFLDAASVSRHLAAIDRLEAAPAV